MNGKLRIESEDSLKGRVGSLAPFGELLPLHYGFFKGKMHSYTSSSPPECHEAGAKLTASEVRYFDADFR